jgi:uncharacterized protein
VELKDELKINASRKIIYAALNDPEILKQCIPGCQSLEKISDTEMTAVVMLKIGPVKANFKGAVELSNLNPPEGYTITGEGTGGPAGFAKGGADVQLVEDGDSTVLRYSVKADIGGKLAQLGSRLIDSTSKKLAGQFFEKFGAIVESSQESPDDAKRTDDHSKQAAKSPAATSKLWIILAAATIAAIVAYMLFQPG